MDRMIQYNIMQRVMLFIDLQAKRAALSYILHIRYNYI